MSAAAAVPSAASLAASSASYQVTGLQNVQVLSELLQEYVFNATIVLSTLTALTPNWPPNAVLTDGQSFDFIIVGGGGAGCVLASRLTENPDWNVLLIEAGGDPPLGGVLAGTNYLMVQTPYDWNYTALYPPEHLESKNLPGFTSSGKVLGGSSGNMYMEYIRGSRADFDAWGELFPEWSYDEVLPYFKKLEGLQEEEILNNPEFAAYHNADGPVKVSQQIFPDYLQAKIDTMIEMYGDIGVKHNLDYNGPDMMGATQEYFTHSKPEPHGLRYGSAQAYLVPAADRSNLFVLKNAYATRVIIEDKVAKGVEVLVNGVTNKFYANNEVIVSAGVAGSTKVLVASGIGAAADLARLNIDVVADLPVGYNLLDHAAVLIILAGHHDLRTNIELREPYLSVDELSIPSVKTFHSFSGADTPDTSITNFYVTPTSPFFLGVCNTGLAFNYNINVCKLPIEANLIHEMFVGEVLLSHPKSKGQIIINSVAPDVDPVFDNNYFSDAEGEDLATMRESLRFFTSLSESNYLKDQSFVIDMGLPACGTFNISSDDYLNCYIKSLMHSPLTYVGSNAMGQVVDTNMKVYGVENLRSVDAGVLPVMPSGHTFAAVVMLAEKISDVIKADYGYTDCADTTTATPAATTATPAATTATPAATTATPAATTATPAATTATPVAATVAAPVAKVAATVAAPVATVAKEVKGLLGTILSIL